MPELSLIDTFKSSLISPAGKVQLTAQLPPVKALSWANVGEVMVGKLAAVNSVLR